MPNKGSGRIRVEEICMNVIASGGKLLALVSRALSRTNEDTVQDIRDDALYQKVEQRIDFMIGLPDDQLRGQLPLLRQELHAARADDLSRTSGDSTRKELSELQERVELYVEEARDLMGGINKAAE